MPFLHLFPFLVIPLGLANFIANMLGGFGIIDMVRRFYRRHCNIWYCHADQKIPPAAFYDLFPDHACTGPWCRTMAVTYGPHALWALALSLCIGQTVPAVCGVALSKALEQVFYPKHSIATHRGI